MLICGSAVIFLIEIEGHISFDEYIVRETRYLALVFLNRLQK